MKNDLLFLSVFSNELVKIVSAIGDNPIEYVGFVIDIDSRYVYIGANDKHSIDFAIRHQEIKYIELFSDEKQIERELRDMPIPTRDEDIN